MNTVRRDEFMEMIENNHPEHFTFFEGQLPLVDDMDGQDLGRAVRKLAREKQPNNPVIQQMAIRFLNNPMWSDHNTSLLGLLGQGGFNVKNT